MNKLALILLALCLFPVVLIAQDKEIKKLFERYDDVTGFSMESEDPDIDINLDGNLSNFLNNIENLYILKFDKEKGRLSDRDAFESKLQKLCDKKGFKTMLDIEGNGSVKMLSRKDNNDETTDFIMVTHGDKESMFFWAASD